jgi:hypoxanthine phosphoribosyltransferase
MPSEEQQQQKEQDINTMTLPKECIRILYTSKQIQERVDQLANEISAYYSSVLKPGESLVLIPVLAGSYMFVADLSRKLSIPCTIDFIALSSYSDSTRSSGEVKILMDTKHSIHQKHVLILEDIIDSGMTLLFLERLLATRSPASLKSCVLLNAPKHKRKVETKVVDFVGFDIGEKFVVGYGLDIAGRYRNLPYIAELKQEVIDSFSK